ncbi:3 saliva family protein [Cystoisospora suis]|uniref:Sugar transporter SWEET1 n=1 Tax=Cystoisospora suis TaxID=483139 RepID=A0A2C6L7P4_9APIC|nr:3 saliva family protein [Cystoisospora suis]
MMVIPSQHPGFSSSSPSSFSNDRNKRGGRPFFLMLSFLLLSPFVSSLFLLQDGGASPWWRSSHITVQATKLRAASTDSGEAESEVSLPRPFIRVSEGALPPASSSSSPSGASYTASFLPSLPAILQGPPSSRTLEGVTHESIVQLELPLSNQKAGVIAGASSAPGTLNTTVVSQQPSSSSSFSLPLPNSSNNVLATTVLPVQLPSPGSSGQSSGVQPTTTPITLSAPATTLVRLPQTPPSPAVASPSSSSSPLQTSSVLLASSGVNASLQEIQQQPSSASFSSGASSSSSNPINTTTNNNNASGVSTPVPVVTVAPSPLPLPTGADHLVHLPPPLIISPSSSSLPGNDNTERGVTASSSSSSFLPRDEGEREGGQRNLSSPTSTGGDLLVAPSNLLPPSASLSSFSSGEQEPGASLQPKQEDLPSSSSGEGGRGVYTPDIPSSLVLPSTSGSLVESVLVESRGVSPPHHSSSLVWSWLLSPLASIPAFVASRVLWLMKVFAVLSAILMQLSPLPTIMRIKACCSTADLQGLPYVMLLLSAIVWLAYGMLRLDIVVLIPNITGVLLSTWYVRVFIRHCKNEEQNRAMRIFIGSSLFLLASLLLIFLFLGLEQGTRLIGLSAAVINVLSYAAPLSALRVILREKSTACLPVEISLGNWLCSSLWLFYGWLSVDLFILLPNLIGTLVGSVQIVLLLLYPPPHYRGFAILKGKGFSSGSHRYYRPPACAVPPIEEEDEEEEGFFSFGKSLIASSKKPPHSYSYQSFSSPSPSSPSTACSSSLSSPYDSDMLSKGRREEDQQVSSSPAALTSFSQRVYDLFSSSSSGANEASEEKIRDLEKDKNNTRTSMSSSHQEERKPQQGDRRDGHRRHEGTWIDRFYTNKETQHPPSSSPRRTTGTAMPPSTSLSSSFSDSKFSPSSSPPSQYDLCHPRGISSLTSTSAGVTIPGGDSQAFSSTSSLGCPDKKFTSSLHPYQESKEDSFSFGGFSSSSSSSSRSPFVDQNSALPYHSNPLTSISVCGVNTPSLPTHEMLLRDWQERLLRGEEEEKGGEVDGYRETNEDNKDKDGERKTASSSSRSRRRNSFQGREEDRDGRVDDRTQFIEEEEDEDAFFDVDNLPSKPGARGGHEKGTGSGEDSPSRREGDSYSDRGKNDSSYGENFGVIMSSGDRRYDDEDDGVASSPPSPSILSYQQKNSPTDMSEKERFHTSWPTRESVPPFSSKARTEVMYDHEGYAEDEAVIDCIYGDHEGSSSHQNYDVNSKTFDEREEDEDIEEDMPIQQTSQPFRSGLMAMMV